MRPSEPDLAWLAGIVDGEGTIGIHRTNVKSQKHPYLRPHIQIANTDLRILEKARVILTAITGRLHNTVVTNKGGNGQKKGYRIAANTQSAAVLLLPLLIPHLAGKREQAELVLDFSTRRCSRTGRGAKWYEFKDQDETEYARCLQLNRRGESALPLAEVFELKRSA